MGDFNRRYATKMFFASNFRGLKHHGYRHAIATRFQQIAPGRISVGAPLRLAGPGGQSALATRSGLARLAGPSRAGAGGSAAATLFQV